MAEARDDAPRSKATTITPLPHREISNLAGRWPKHPPLLHEISNLTERIARGSSPASSTPHFLLENPCRRAAPSGPLDVVLDAPTK
ncbi:hypothetical protein A7982_12201 [Minicystis rosea]|nr:hypothetical protein A7982_12201 [Minicystis rosea]